MIGESLNRAGIKDYIELDIDTQSLKVLNFNRKNLAHLLTFVYGTAAKKRADRVVKETRQLSTLANLLKSKRAATALENGATFQEAALIIETPDETLTRLRGLLRECKSVVTRFSRRPTAAEMVRTFDAFHAAAKRFLKDGR